MTNVPIPEPGQKPPPMPPPPFPGQQPVREPDPKRLPDEEPLPNPDENDQPPQHADDGETEAAFSGGEAFDEFAREIGARSRYLRSPESRRFLEAVAVTCRRRVRKVARETIFWRAQVGHDWERDETDGKKVRGPHPRERMKPLHDRAYEGRVNPKGIPCLYFATEREVAVSEVRPWLGSAVTVARFRTLADMELVDCTWHGERDDGVPEVEMEVWRAIDEAFSRPVVETDNKAEYAATQAIAEVFRGQGFDGVVYRSAYSGNGRNVALFDLEAAEVIDQALIQICDIRLDFRELEPEDEPGGEAREIPSRKGR